MSLLIRGPAPLGLVQDQPPAFLPPGAELWVNRQNAMSAIMSLDAGKHHISVSLPHRYPTWMELLTVWRWYAGPEVEGVIVVPRAAKHLNLVKTCMHVWESKCGHEGDDR